MSTPDVPETPALAPLRYPCARCGAATANLVFCDRCRPDAAADFPRAATRAEKLAEMHYCLDFYRTWQEAKCPTTGPAPPSASC